MFFGPVGGSTLLPNTRLTDYNNIRFNISIYGRIYNTLIKYVFESTLINVCLI